MLDTKGLVSLGLLSVSILAPAWSRSAFFDTSILITPTHTAVVRIVKRSWSTELDPFQMKLSQKMCSKNTSNVLHLLHSVGWDESHPAVKPPEMHAGTESSFYRFAPPGLPLFLLPDKIHFSYLVCVITYTYSIWHVKSVQNPQYLYNLYQRFSLLLLCRR